jgi:predicted GNAT family acetyltransferase
MAMPTAPRITDNPQASRYELWLGATRAGFIQYRAEPGTVLLVHTEVAPALAGQGLGERLVAGALADLRARGLNTPTVDRDLAAQGQGRGADEGGHR